MKAGVVGRKSTRAIYEGVSRPNIGHNHGTVPGCHRDPTRPGCCRVKFYVQRSIVVSGQRLRGDEPERFMPYQLALVKANIPMPDYDPPKYPQALRHASQKRNADQEVNKPATWVISHLCHNKLCVNPISLTWEPSWFNRLRDNWPAGNACTHRLRPCLKPRQTIGPVMDWTEYI